MTSADHYPRVIESFPCVKCGKLIETVEVNSHYTESNWRSDKQECWDCGQPKRKTK